MAATALGRRRQPARSFQSTSSSIIETKPASKAPSKAPSLAKRLLFPSLPHDAELPRLLCSEDAPRELDLELYDFIALALRAYVIPWWTKITRYDKEFLPEITRILTAVIRVLETRLTSTDLSPLIYRDLPTLITQHYIDFRNAQAKLHTSYATGGVASLPQLFHQMQPHMAVSSDGQVDEVYLRQAVDHLLKACLPPEDYEPEVERYIIREIVIRILASVLPRITQPWFIHKTILDLMGPEQAKEKPPESPDYHSSQATGETTHRGNGPAFSFQSFVIFILSAVQSVSGACLMLIHAYKQTRDTIKKATQNPPLFPHQHPSKSESAERTEPIEASVSATRKELPGALTFTPLKTRIPSHALPSPMSDDTPILSRSASSVSEASSSLLSSPPNPKIESPPDYAHPPLTLLLTIITPPPLPVNSNSRGSFSTSLALTNILTLIINALSPFCTRLLPYLLYTHVLNYSRLTDIVRLARNALFPDGWLAPPPVDPTPEEQAAMREEVERRILGSVPAPLVFLLGPTAEARKATLDASLDPLSSAACNAHLAMLILDLVLLSIVPEMGIREESTPIPTINADQATSKV